MNLKETLRIILAWTKHYHPVKAGILRDCFYFEPESQEKDKKCQEVLHQDIDWVYDQTFVWMEYLPRECKVFFFRTINDFFGIHDIEGCVAVGVPSRKVLAESFPAVWDYRVIQALCTYFGIRGVLQSEKSLLQRVYDSKVEGRLQSVARGNVF